MYVTTCYVQFVVELAAVLLFHLYPQYNHQTFFKLFVSHQIFNKPRIDEKPSRRGGLACRSN
jgi:hypothetical protein